MLIRRIGVLQQLIEEYGVNAGVKLVPLGDNLADELRRVRQQVAKKTVAKHRKSWIGVAVRKVESISDIHLRTGHFGVSRTLNFEIFEEKIINLLMCLLRENYKSHIHKFTIQTGCYIIFCI